MFEHEAGLLVTRSQNVDDLNGAGGKEEGLEGRVRMTFGRNWKHRQTREPQDKPQCYSLGIHAAMRQWTRIASLSREEDRVVSKERGECATCKKKKRNLEVGLKMLVYKATWIANEEHNTRRWDQ